MISKIWVSKLNNDYIKYLIKNNKLQKMILN